MFLARVTGSIVATQKVASMVGSKLLTVEPMRVDPADRAKLIGTGRTLVCVDTVGAGLGETVLVVQGSSARMAPVRIFRARSGSLWPLQALIASSCAALWSGSRKMSDVVPWRRKRRSGPWGRRCAASVGVRYNSGSGPDR